MNKARYACDIALIIYWAPSFIFQLGQGHFNSMLDAD